jgi:hypothetical protein
VARSGGFVGQRRDWIFAGLGLPELAKEVVVLVYGLLSCPKFDDGACTLVPQRFRSFFIQEAKLTHHYSPEGW